jgi:hypothetical protein
MEDTMMAATKYAGIDYSRGMANRDASGIHYGVIPANALAWWYDSAEADYGEPHCPECEAKLDTWMECKIHGEIQPEDAYPDEPFGYYYKDDVVEAYQGPDGDIFVTKSNHVTHAQYCSPCAPGAGYLPNPCESGPLCYCFGPDWFDDDSPMPYQPTKLNT